MPEVKSFYCWIMLTFFIIATTIFMVRFYYKAMNEISANSVANINRIEEVLNEEI